MQVAQRQGVSIALVQEPYVGRIGAMKQTPGTQIIQCTLSRQKPVKAAVIVFGNTLEVIHDPQLVTENVAAVLLKAGTLKLGIVSVYLEGDQELDPYLKRIQEVSKRMPTGNILVGGDVNAKSQWWGGGVEDHRGGEYNAFLNEMELQILNTGQVPTFETHREGRMCTSIVDVTACSMSLLGRIDGWRVDRNLTTSDHNAIAFTMRLEKALEPLRPVSTRIYNTKKAKWSDFTTNLAVGLAESDVTPERVKKVECPEDLEDLLSLYTEAIHNACEHTVPKLRMRKAELKPPWWTDSLERLKKEVLRRKRRIRNAAPIRRQFVIDQYVEAKNSYQRKAEEEATQHWKEFCSTQDRESMWDGIYRVLRKTARRQEDTLLRDAAGLTLSPENSAKLLAKTFYPDDSVESETDHHKTTRGLTEGKTPAELTALSDDDPLFTTAELDTVLRGLNPKKAPGPDGLTSDICTAAIHCNREVFMELANKCLSLPHFPKQWKVAHVCILRKPGKEDYTHPKSYRPIGLLSVLGKIVEKLLITRIQWHLLPGVSGKQYGFMPQRGTEEALYDLIQHVKAEVRMKKVVLLVSLDIEGAFDNAWWPALKRQLVERKCPRNLYALVESYLKDRKIKVNYARATSEKETTKGCVQGSIGGPTFWNLILDPLLHKMAISGVFCQAFADDVVLVFSDHAVSALQLKAETTLATVHEWGVQNKLNFAAHKTNAMTITKKLKYDPPQVHMCGTRLNLVNEVKLLGLVIDCKLTFNAHVSATCAKAADIYKQLACAAKVTWGLNRSITRTIYVSVIEPIVLYAASAWSPAAEKIMVKNQFDSLQRGFAQKICKAYRTVSLTSALILSGLLPLDLRVQEAADLFKARKGYSVDFVPPGRDIERKVGPLQNPHPASLITTEYERLDNLDAETINKLRIVGPTIYTDGSKIEGKVGAALTLWKENREKKYSTFRLEPHNTVFQSELYALFRAVKLARQSRAAQEINIMSDSRSSLDLLRNASVTHQLALETKSLIKEIGEEGRVVRFFWLRAHVGTPGNERADELAKNAALKKKTAPDYSKVPISFIRKQIREKTVQKWQARYESSTTGSVTKAFLPTVSLARRALKDMTLTPVHVQILTGHGGFGAYLHRFRLKDSPSCICDPSHDETIWHLLFDCPRYGRERMDLEIKIQAKLTQSALPTIMEDLTTRTPFLDYASVVAKSAAAANGSTAFRRDQLPDTPVPTPTLPQTLPTLTHPTTQMSTLPLHTSPSPLQPQPQTSDASPGLVISTTQSLTANELLQKGAVGSPGIRIRGVAMFMDNDNEKLGVSFCRAERGGKVTIPPGLALLLNGNTSETRIRRAKLDSFAEARVGGQPCRIAQLPDKVVVLFEWDGVSPFARACALLSSLGEGPLGGRPALVSVDVMTLGFERGEVVDRNGCLIASQHHEVIVYEGRGEDLSFLKAPGHDTATASCPAPLPLPGPSHGLQSGSERLQTKIADQQKQKEEDPEDALAQSKLLRKCKATATALKHFFSAKAPTPCKPTRQVATASRSSIAMTKKPSGSRALGPHLDDLGRQGAAVWEFLRPPLRVPEPQRPVRTRADKGQVIPPSLRQISGPMDHVANAFLEFLAVVRATREVNQATCRDILKAFQQDNESLLKVRIGEAEAAVYNNDTSQTIRGVLSGQYMVAYSATSGFVALDEEKTQRTGRLFFRTPIDDPIVVTARCTRIMLDDRMLEMAKTIEGKPGERDAWGEWTVPRITWINGVPGCGKTTEIVQNFNEDEDVVVTTTLEAAGELRRRLEPRIGEATKFKVRTMASVLANGFRKPCRITRLTVDEASMNHFGAIVMAARLSGAGELVLVGDINQLPYLDRENLFVLQYKYPDSLVTVKEERYCTYRNPMDVPYALSEVYNGMYSAASRVRSLSRERYTDARIPPDLPETLYLVFTQEEKKSLSILGFGSGTDSRLLTIHESQGLTSARVIVIQTKSSKIRLHDSVPHAVVAVSRHTEKCVYYTDCADDALGRFIARASEVSEKAILEHNLKTAMKHRDTSIIKENIKIFQSGVEPAIG